MVYSLTVIKTGMKIKKDLIKTLAVSKFDLDSEDKKGKPIELHQPPFFLSSSSSSREITFISD